MDNCAADELMGTKGERPRRGNKEQFWERYSFGEIRLALRRAFSFSQGNQAGQQVGRGLAQNLVLKAWLSGSARNSSRFFLMSRTPARASPCRKGFCARSLPGAEILQQSLRWNAADVEIDVGMPPHQKERGLHPQRASSVARRMVSLGKSTATSST